MRFPRAINLRSWKLWLRVVGLAAVAYFLFVWKAFWSPDALFVIFLVVFLMFGQAKQYIRRFAPFALLLVSYDGFRGLLPYLNKHVHYTTMINFDRWIGGGTVPTIRLQHLLYHGHLMWYDYYFYGLYMAHFVTPFLLAIAIWKLRPNHYWTYVSGLIALSYAGFLTYLIFPAAPPWLAAQMGYLPKIEHLSTDIWWTWGVHNFPTVYDKFAPNPVAAVPSLHAAYPTLDWLFIRKWFGNKAAAVFAIYPVTLWIGLIYMGEHYLFDVILGIGYAVTVYFATMYCVKRNWTPKVVWQKLRGHSAGPKLTPQSAVSPE